jgi:hypothetical protein
MSDEEFAFHVQSEKFRNRPIPEHFEIDEALLNQLGERAAKAFSARTGVPLSSITKVMLTRVGERLFSGADRQVRIYLNDQCQFAIHYVGRHEKPRMGTEWVEHAGTSLRAFTF